MPTRSLGFQSFYQAQLTSSISDTDLTIPLDVLPTPSEGILVIESTSSTKREIIYYTSKTASAVVCPSGAGNGRGYDGTTATSHLANSAVIMAPVAQMFKSLQDGSSMSSTVSLQNVTVSGSLTVGGQTPTADWSNLASAPNTVAANGNRSYTLTFNGVDYTGTMQAGTRVRTTRTVAAPTYMGGVLNGTNQYFTKVTPTGTLSTVTDNFTLMAWVELTSYPSFGGILGRTDASPANGFLMDVNSTGQVRVGVYNGGATNYRIVTTYQSLPLNKKVHVAATWTGGTVVIYFDGVSVPVGTASTSGTAPTTAGTGGDFSIGRTGANTASYLTGYVAGCGVFNAVLSAATIRSYMSQALAGSETNCIGAWTLNNTPNDQTSTNNLTAQNSAGYTVRSPYSTSGNDVAGGTYDYGIIQSISFSTNTTAVIQVPEGNTIPTSGGVSALAYSTNKVPYGMPVSANRWEILHLRKDSVNTGAVASSATITNQPGWSLTIPVGSWNASFNVYTLITVAVATNYLSISVGLSTSNNSYSDYDFFQRGFSANVSSTEIDAQVVREKMLSTTAATIFYLNTQSPLNNTTQYINGGAGSTYIRCIPSNL